MSDLLDNLINKHFPSRSSILSLVDDYTLFCYYLGQDIGLNQAILSPLRTVKADTLPSFVVYPDKRGELRYFDHGTGEGGSVFDLIQNLFGLRTFEEVCSRISEDFGLNVGTGEISGEKQAYLKAGRPPMIGLTDVINHDDFTLAGIAYWNAYHIDREILKEYNVNQVKFICMENNIMIKIPLNELAFSYRIGVKHKIYQPHDPEYKFRNNFPRTYVEGYYQLMKRPVKSQILFITKSTKDVMCFRKMGLDAIAPKAENQVIPDFILDTLKTLYKHIFMVFDDDPAGRKGVTRYPFPAIWIPLEVNVKDTADHQKKHGPEKTKQVLKRLVTS